jgi:hypothetical protein
MKMEAAASSETLAPFYLTTRRPVSNDSSIYVLLMGICDEVLGLEWQIKASSEMLQVRTCYSNKMLLERKFW